MSKESSKKNQPSQKLFPVSKVDLMAELEAKRISLHDIRFGIAGSKRKNVKEQKMIKKKIARILTGLRKLSV